MLKKGGIKDETEGKIRRNVNAQWENEGKKPIKFLIKIAGEPWMMKI